ncbi:hypothetical protein [Streptomyces sp. NBC_00658]|uniref:hypothetical protein n=1 Tax=Streptomyces sp. NBC_00658 TaxID=2975800 RepID=UPI0032456560
MDTFVKFKGEERAAPDKVRLVTVILGTLYTCTRAAGFAEYLHNTVGPDLVKRCRPGSVSS